MTPLELLYKARDIFAEMGGAKQVLQSRSTGEVCLNGAMNKALTGSAYSWGCVIDESLREKADTLLALEVESQYQGLSDPREVPQGVLADFNNRLDTTKDDVLAIFDKTIQKAEEQK